MHHNSRMVGRSWKLAEWECALEGITLLVVAHCFWISSGNFIKGVFESLFSWGFSFEKMGVIWVWPVWALLFYLRIIRFPRIHCTTMDFLRPNEDFRRLKDAHLTSRAVAVFFELNWWQSSYMKIDGTLHRSGVQLYRKISSNITKDEFRRQRCKCNGVAAGPTASPRTASTCDEGHLLACGTATYWALTSNRKLEKNVPTLTIILDPLPLINCYKFKWACYMFLTPKLY